MCSQRQCGKCGGGGCYVAGSGSQVGEANALRMVYVVW